MESDDRITLPATDWRVFLLVALPISVMGCCGFIGWLYTIASLIMLVWFPDIFWQSCFAC